MESKKYKSVPKLEQKYSETKATLAQLIAVNVNNILLVSNGMTSGYPTILIPGLLADKSNTIPIEEHEISWIGSITFMTALIGCFLSGIVTHPIGRTKSIQIASPFVVVSWLIFNFASEVWHLYLALCLCGFFSSILEAPILSYKAEVSESHLRGILSSTSTLSVIVGVLLEFILGTFFHWRTAALITSAVPFIGFVLLFFIPESPLWLLMKTKTDLARRSLAWLRGWTTVDHIEEEYQTMLSYCNELPFYESIQNKNKTVFNNKSKWSRSILNYTKKSFLCPAVLVLCICFLANCTGLCTLQTYAVSIFATLRVPIDKYYATVILGVAEVIGCFVSLFFVRSFGKRVTEFVSLLGVAVCNVVVGIYAYAIDVKYLQFQNETTEIYSSSNAWLPLCALVSMAFIGHVGLRVIAWALIGEVFSNETRAVGCGIGGAVFFLLSFFANKTFLSIASIMEISGIYWFHAGVCILGFIIMYFFLPETEGKDLQEVINHFAGISKLDNKIKKRIVNLPSAKNKNNLATESNVDQ